MEHLPVDCGGDDDGGERVLGDAFRVRELVLLDHADDRVGDLRDGVPWDQGPCDQLHWDHREVEILKVTGLWINHLL